MSALAAIVSMSGRAVSRADIVALTQRQQARGPDGLAVWTSDRAGLGLAHLATDPAAQHATPAISRDGSCVAVIDGRLESRALVPEQADDPDAAGDASAIANAYAVAGDAALARLRGAFACIVWDVRRQRLVAVRDVFGFKPLLWTSCDGEVRVASEVQALTTSSSPIDEAMVGELLSGLVASRSATVYRLVARIEPGAMLVVDAAGTRVTPLLSLALAGGDGSSQSRAERHEEFRARLLDAVRRRTSDTTRAGVMLSGGLDSATVLAAARRTAGWVDAWTVAQASACDETPRARETVSHCGGAHHVAPATARSYDYQASVRRHRDLPIPPPCANSVGLRRAASAAGARVLLTGLGGDEWFGRSLWHAADLLRAGRISAVARSWSRSMTARNPPRFSAVVQATVAPFVPAVFRPLARRAVAQTATPWIRGDWARRVDLHERLRVRPTIDAPTIALRARLLDVLSGASVLANEQDDRVAAEAGIEDRAPYFDQALVEFALSLPAADADAERPKGFVRDACAAWLPALHATPEPALDFSHLFVDALDALGGRPFFARLRAVEAGWVEPSWVARALGEAWGGKPAPSRAAARGLWHVAAVETWLRTLD